MILFTFVLFWNNFAGTTSNINTTMLAFHYGYGFISRGLLGTIYGVLNRILPWNLYTFGWAMLFFEGCFLVFVVLLFLFCMKCLRMSDEKVKQSARYFIILYFIAAIPMFSSEYNLGRLDMYCLMCSMLSVLLMVYGKAEWLAVPLSAIGVMFHQGHVFMYMGMVLAMQLYKALDAVKGQEDLRVIFSNKTSRKYLGMFLATMLTVSALFIWFEGFSHIDGEKFADQLIDTACSMGPDADYHIEVVDHEILGVDLSAKEWEYHKQNFVEFPLYCLFMLPYILIALGFARELLGLAKTKIDKVKYIIACRCPDDFTGYDTKSRLWPLDLFHHQLLCRRIIGTACNARYGSDRGEPADSRQAKKQISICGLIVDIPAFVPAAHAY